MKIKNSILKIVLMSFILSFSSNIFAQSAIDEAKSASQSPNLTFDGYKSGSGQYSPNFQPTPLAAPPPAEPKKEPGVLSKMWKDLKDNKMGYLTIGGLAAATGYLLFGTLGAAAGGLGLVLLFVLMIRNVS